MFERAGVKAESKANFVRMDVDGVPFVVWGSGAQRTPKPGALPPPGYVGGWMDFAIVRGR